MKIEIDKPVIPQFVADWIENLYNGGGSKHDAIDIMVERGGKCDKTVHDWYVDNKDTFITAVMHDYNIQEKSLYYAKIKGWELTEDECAFWNCRMIITNSTPSKLFVGDKENDLFFRTKMTIEQWNKVGINGNNADFEEVD